MRRLRLVLLAALLASGLGLPAAQAATKAPALQVLNALPVGTESRDGYQRERFRHWTDFDGDGCNARQQVLIIERVSGTVRGCVVVNGTWVSAYDGVVTSNPSSFDIDHFVPLAEAWDSGAWSWSDERREAFANDTAFSGSLIAVTASSNRSKSDRDSAEWLPALGRCTYAKTWIAVKYRWRLSVDAAEKAALQRILQSCSPLMEVPPLTAAAGIDTGAARPSSGAPQGGTSPSGGLDPRFRTCGDANAAGYGPYVRGTDPEFDWYIDRDRDGVTCER